MTTERESTRIVRSWLQTDEHESAEHILGTVLDRLDTTPQRRPWWAAWRTYFMNRTFKFAAGVAAVLVVAAVALALYLSRPTVVPSASPSPGPSPSGTAAAPTVPAIGPASDSPSNSGTPQATQEAGSTAPFGLFLRHVNGQSDFSAPDLWAIRADGTAAQDIFPGLGLPSVAWSQDGKRVLAVSQNGPVGAVDIPPHHVYVAEVSGNAIGPFVDTGFTTGGETACNDKSRKPAPCQDSAFTFAPDGEHIAFVQTCSYSIPSCMFLTTMDLRSGELTELSATLETGDSPLELPAWSTDGSQIAFTREDGRNRIPESKLYVIGTDGRNLRQIELGGLSAHGPQWSPDGGEITFMSTNVYTVRSDGTDLHQLTSDALSSEPQWISSNQIRVRHSNPTLTSSTFALIDPDDGSIVVEYDLVDLFEAIRTIEPPGSVVAVSVSGDPDRAFYWQPTP